MNGEFTFHHGGVSVPDLEAAIAWYGRVLGFKLERRFYIAPAKTNVAMIRKGPLRIELFEPEEGLPLPESRRHPREDIQTHGNKHLAFRVDDLEAFMAELTAGGTEIVFVVNEQFGLGCFVRDCAGNLIEFVAEPIA